MLLRSLLLPMALLLYPALVNNDLAFDGLAKAAMAFFGVLLASSPALRWHHCQRQAVLVAGIAPVLLPSWPLMVRPMQRWRLLGLCWHPCLHRAGIIASIALLLSLLVLCWRHCPWCAGVFALIKCPLRWHPPFRRYRCTWGPCRIWCC